MAGSAFDGEKMSSNFRSASSRSARFSRAHPIVTGLIVLSAVFVTAIALIAVYWPQIDELHLPPVLAMAIGWFVAVGTTLGIALLLMWVSDQREVNRSRRAIRLNFDHALMAMLDLAHQFTTHAERNQVGQTIESAQKQIIAASARLKRYENKLTAFPPDVLNAYADLENEIDVALEELNDLHRKLRSERDGRLAKFGFEMLDRVARFDEFLNIIDARPTQASIAFERLSTAQETPPPAAAATPENSIAVRRA
jgi:low affinity Fe/Cu permease